MSSIFTKIITGQLPSYTIYEDEYTYTFLDLYPHQQWQTLIVPKLEHDHFYSLPEPYYQALFKTTQMITPLLKTLTQAKRIWVVIEWLEVPHAHVKLIPINAPWDLSAPQYKATDDELLTIQQAFHDLLHKKQKQL